MYEFICARGHSKKKGSIRVRTLGRNESCDCHTHIPHPPHTAKKGGEKITSQEKKIPLRPQVHTTDIPGNSRRHMVKFAKIEEI
jgi:hypothetical protein